MVEQHGDLPAHRADHGGGARRRRHRPGDGGAVGDQRGAAHDGVPRAGRRARPAGGARTGPSTRRSTCSARCSARRSTACSPGGAGALRSGSGSRRRRSPRRYSREKCRSGGLTWSPCTTLPPPAGSAASSAPRCATAAVAITALVASALGVSLDAVGPLLTRSAVDQAVAGSTATLGPIVAAFLGLAVIALRGGVPAAVPRRQARARRAARPAPPGLRRRPAARRRAAGRAAHRAGRLPGDHRPQPPAEPPVDRAARAGLLRARRRVARRHAVAVAAAHAGGVRRAAARAVDHHAQPPRAVPGHLVGAAEGGRHRPAGRGDGHRRPGREGVRAGGPGGRHAGGGRAAALRRAAARGPDDRPAQPRAARPCPRSARCWSSASAAGSPLNGSITLGTFLAFTTYVAGLVGPGPHARRARRGGPARAGGRRAGVRPGRLAARRRRSGAPGHAAGGPAGRGARRRHVRLHAARAGARRGQPHRGAGGDARAGRAAGFGQVHGRAAAAALLRPAGGRAAPRRGAAAVAAAGRPAQRAGRGVRGGVPVLRHHPGQHRLRPPRRLGGRGAGRGAGGAGARVRRAPPRRLRHARRRARAHALRRAAAAGRAGQGGAHRPAGAGARRRHVRGRHRHRSRHPRHAARAHEGPHHPARRPPALLAGAGRPDRRPRRADGWSTSARRPSSSPGARCSASCSRSAGPRIGRSCPRAGSRRSCGPPHGPAAERTDRQEAAGGMGGGPGLWNGVPATPELLAAVEALPPPPDEPRLPVDPDHARSRLPAGPAAAPGARAGRRGRGARRPRCAERAGLPQHRPVRRRRRHHRAGARRPRGRRAARRGGRGGELAGRARWRRWPRRGPGRACSTSCACAATPTCSGWGSTTTSASCPAGS